MSSDPNTAPGAAPETLVGDAPIAVVGAIVAVATALALTGGDLSALGRILGRAWTVLFRAVTG